MTLLEFTNLNYYHTKGRNMQLLQFVEQIAKEENMGQVCSDAQVDIKTLSYNKMLISWDALREGKVVRQYAEFKFNGICLDWQK